MFYKTESLFDNSYFSRYVYALMVLIKLKIIKQTSNNLVILLKQLNCLVIFQILIWSFLMFLLNTLYILIKLILCIFSSHNNYKRYAYNVCYIIHSAIHTEVHLLIICILHIMIQFVFYEKLPMSTYIVMYTSR